MGTIADSSKQVLASKIDPTKSLTCAHRSGPEGYVERLDWMEKMSKRYVQTKCDKCNLWHIWKKPRKGYRHDYNRLSEPR